MQVRQPLGTHVSSAGDIADAAGFPIDQLVDTVNNGTIIFLDKFKVTQCLAVLHTGTFSSIDCSLSPHCGEVTYFKERSTWYGSEVGICVGAGQEQVLVLNHEIQYLHLNNFDWGNVSYPYVRLNPYNIFEHVVTFPIINVNRKYYVISEHFLGQYPLYGPVLNLLRPNNLIMNEAKMCMPIVTSSLFPTILGPFPDFKSALRQSVMAIHDHSDIPLYNTSVCMDIYSCYDASSGYYGYDRKYMTLNCNPATQTTNLLPIGVASIARTSGHILYTVVYAAIKLLTDCFLLVVTWSIAFVDPLVLLTSLVYTVVYQSRSLIDSLVISVSLGFITANFAWLLQQRQEHVARRY